MARFALLGDVAFETLTAPTGSESRYASDYAEHARIEGKPRLQWIADRLDELSLTLQFHDTYCDPDTEIGKLRAAMGAHVPLPYVMATGEYRGEYVIQEISTVARHAGPSGRTLAATASLKLRECPDPKGERRAQVARARAPAVRQIGQAVQAPPETKTAALDLAAPNLPEAKLKTAVVAMREATTAIRAARDTLRLVRQLAAIDPQAVVEQLVRDVAAATVVNAAERCLAALGPVADRVAEAVAIVALAGQLAADAQSAVDALAGLSPENLLGRLDILDALFAGMDAALTTSAAKLARASVRVLVREVL